MEINLKIKELFKKNEDVFILSLSNDGEIDYENPISITKNAFLVTISPIKKELKFVDDKKEKISVFYGKVPMFFIFYDNLEKIKKDFYNIVKKNRKVVLRKIKPAYDKWFEQHKEQRFYFYGKFYESYPRRKIEKPI